MSLRDCSTSASVMAGCPWPSMLAPFDVQTSTLHSTPGYDDETGVGTPNGARFVFGLGH